MSTIDEILASGKYADRRGRTWSRCGDERGRHWWKQFFRFPLDDITPAHMRLLIERDQHRDVCLGLWDCADHPVPRVAAIESDYGSFAPNSRVYDQHSTHSDAMNAARALAVAA